MAPTTTRSAVTTRSYLTSSTSTASSKTSPGNVTKKKFGCHFPDCGKSFSRSEHLHRHALNHKDGNNTCLRCSAHFRRRDLLDRHMARHKEKDNEAGGEGLGVLATRKRLWRDENGKIVNSRRPSYTTDGVKRRQTNRPERKLSKANSSSSCDEPATPMTRTSSIASSTIVVSPPTQIPSFSRREPEPKLEPQQEQDWLSITTHQPILEPSPLETSSSSELSSFDSLYEDTTWPSLHNEPTLSASHSSTSISSLSSSTSSPMLSPSTSHHEYPTPSWSPLSTPTTTAPQPFQTFMGAMAELPYEDIFKPEHGRYDWQAWNSQVLMSKVREEKYDPLFSSTANEEKRGGWLGGDAFRRPFAGLSGGC